MIDRENALYLTMLKNIGHPIDSVVPLNDPDYFEEEMLEYDDDEEEE